MMKARDVKAWLNTLDDDGEVWIDGGERTLVSNIAQTSEQMGRLLVHLEVGGDPDEGLLDDPGELLVEPCDEDLFTSDGVHYNYLGKLAFKIHGPEYSLKLAYEKWCDENNYWPNVWENLDRGGYRQIRFDE